MTVVALTHGYPPAWNMGGEVSLHRTMQSIDGDRLVLTATEKPYTIDGVRVEPIDTPNVLDMRADPSPIAAQLEKLGASVVIAQNELSLPAVKAARRLNIPSVVNVHAPPRYGSTTKAAIPLADHAIYNTYTSAVEWGEPDALVLHPPVGKLPPKPRTLPKGDAYTIMSSLGHKGVDIVLDLATRKPEQRFIVVESPAAHMEPSNLRARIEMLRNVELHPRVHPDQVAGTYLSQTRILLVPGRYETYGMSAIEAAGYGIPSVHVDTPHAREGIGEAAVMVPPLNVAAAQAALTLIEDTYTERSKLSRARAEWIALRDQIELNTLTRFMANITVRPEVERQPRASRIIRTSARRR